jgi:hypothetical protein|tara:strand:- start:2469 stop:3134 length:666 start_codon:yes stop_codon:yes gene_type:complete
MGYLDGSSITVDAILTKQGRRLLARGEGLGISYFCLTDTGVDYRLWNPDHPSGSAYYGEAIEGLPQVEALPQGEYFMRNKLVTLKRDITAMPILSLSTSDVTFLENVYQPQTITVNTLNYTPTDTIMAIIPNYQYLTPVQPAVYRDIAGVANQFISQQEIPYAKMVEVTEGTDGATFSFRPSPDDQKRTMTITFISRNTGAYASATVTIPSMTVKYDVKTT